jgi:hypothetical protein
MVIIKVPSQLQYSWSEDYPGHGVQHNVTTRTTLWAPNGAPVAQITSAGQSSAFVSAVAVEGAYQVTTEHTAAGSQAPLGNTASPTSLVAIPMYTYQLSGIHPWNGTGHYARCRTGATRCLVIDANLSEFSPATQYPQYALFELVTFTAGGATSCFKKSRAAASSCIPDPRGPDNH